MAIIAPATSAATIDTYDFTQDGYDRLVGTLGAAGVLTGSFTGIVEADGLIELADLSSLSLEFNRYAVAWRVLFRPLA